jgi:transposase
MWEGYLNAVEEYIAAHDDVTARLVVDRFHVAQQYRDDFDALRKQEMKRLKQELPAETYDQDCKGTLWSLRKNHQDLDDEERIQLRRLFRHSPRLHQAYTLREELTAIFNSAHTIQEAERRLTSWVKKVERFDASCFRPFTKTLSSHWTLIINYFADRVTSGFVEGLNNKIRTITRRCYGIRKTTTLFQRLWLDLETRLSTATRRHFTLSTT